ncbi:MAG: P1 family peptidase [Desulfurellaceae bacterium]|nr:P1 family peptidase [Desulfurellaceae bacterium]
MHLENLLIGHQSLAGNTGISVLLFTQRVVCAYHLCGSAPGTRDVVPLNLGNSVEEIDALVFTGGSAYGLGASTGVMEYQQGQGRGLATPGRIVPIVPTACIFDLAYGEPAYPAAQDAYAACKAATNSEYARGRVGVGRGATVGKGLENGRPMTGGFGVGHIQAGELKVLACAAVNAFGDVRENDKIIAGAVDTHGQFLNIEQHLLRGSAEARTSLPQNTTLVAVVTNATLSQEALFIVAKMATAGFARALSPAFSPWDGDLVFSVSAGQVRSDVTLVGTIAAEVTRLAILDAVRESQVIG